MSVIKQRDKAIDVMKGIGIILMVTVHTLGPESPITNYIHTSNMPMFFLVAGYFAKKKPSIEILTSSYNRLIKPFFFICFNVVLIKMVKHYFNSRTLYIDIDGILTCMGPGWFLLALFWGRFIFNFFIKYFPRYYLIPAFIISTIPIMFNWLHPIFVPLGVLQGLTCVIFIAIGYYSKQHNILQFMMNHVEIFFTIALLCWLNTSIFGRVEMAYCIFKNWVIDYIGAIGGVFLYYCISKSIVTHSTILTSILTKVSFFSLAVLGFHAIDFCIPLWFHLSPFINDDYMVTVILLGRFLVIYLCIVVTAHIPILYQLFTGKPFNKTQEV